MKYCPECASVLEVRRIDGVERKRWQFGRLALTTVIVKQWLEKTALNDNFQEMPPPLMSSQRND